MVLASFFVVDVSTAPTPVKEETELKKEKDVMRVIEDEERQRQEEWEKLQKQYGG